MSRVVRAIGGCLSAHSPRILLFHEDLAPAQAVRSRLDRAGFDVSTVRSFMEAVPHLMSGRCDLLLIYLPETVFLRYAMLSEIREGAPSLPIVALAQAVTDPLREVLQRLGVAAILPSSAEWQDILQAVQQALGIRQ